MSDLSDTDEFLAVHLPHLAPLKNWLKYLNDKIGKLKRDPDVQGSAQLHAQLNGGTRMDWTDWSYRERHKHRN